MGKITKKDTTKTTNTKKVTAVKKVTPKKAPDKKPVVKKTPVKEKAKVETLAQVDTIPESNPKENGVLVLLTGGFDPLHSGHLDYIDSAKELGREKSWFGAKVIIGVNSDEWLIRKKGRVYMPLEERVRLLIAMRNVDQVIIFDDADDSSKNAIRLTRQLYADEHIIFANGGDRTTSNCVEMDIDDPNLSFEFGVGGKKTESSSDLLGEWASPRTNRDYGYYRVLHENGNEVKVKEFTIVPGASLTMQRHKNRAESWFIAEGTASLFTCAYPNNPREVWDILMGKFKKHETAWIGPGEWHQLVNQGTEPLKIIEIQYGTECSEEDVERVYKN